MPKPDANATGTDSFTYKVNDGKADSAVATVKIEVEGLRWVRVGKAAVNPEKLPLEYYGGGVTPGFFGEERFKDMLTVYTVTETGFTVRDRWQDREYVAWDITVNCDFDPPEAVLMPGRSYRLNVRFSHSGKTTEIPAGEAFTYFSADAGIEPDEPFAYSPWSTGFDGVTSKTYTLTAPQGRAGDTMQIQVGWWNAAMCTVIWTYKLQ